MESSKREKGITLDDSDTKPLMPILIRLRTDNCAVQNILIDKNEFKIGRGRNNDEIILDAAISRRQCIFRCEGNEEWTIKDTSSSTTFVNDVPLVSGENKRLYEGDIIQFSLLDWYKYKFILVGKEERRTKKPRTDEQILDNVLIEQKTFSENQECQKRALKEKLQTKQKEQDTLKQELEQLLVQQCTAEKNTEDLKKQINILESKIECGNIQEQHLHKIYADLLEKLENERVKFEKRLNDEKQKWQEALDVSKQEKEELEIKMREQMEKWRKEQQIEWKSVMENRVKEEKSIQAQLLNEKTVLEEKLKKIEEALKEKEAKVEAAQADVAGPSELRRTVMEDSCIFLEFVNDLSGIQIFDTIDLTLPTQITINREDQKESVINNVTNIMDEQLTCNVCSELFVKATTLNCMHTFCHYCIARWSEKRNDCPICRTPIASMNISLVLDNFIERMLENLPTELKERRKELIEEREKAISVVQRKRKIR
ncbi:uncharacterized protein LOC144470483 [Augochlora pura]